MRRGLIGLFLICCSIVQAQNAIHPPKPSPFRFHSMNMVGVQWGKENAGHMLYSANGIGYRTWFAGIGTGIDFYQFRSIPLVLDIRKAILKNEKTPFIYVAGGKHFTWLSKEVKDPNSSGLKGSWYYDAGAGYQLPLNHQLNMVFTLGISEKKMTEEYDVMPWSSVWPRPPQAIQKREYNFRRIAFKIGLGF